MHVYKKFRNRFLLALGCVSALVFVAPTIVLAQTDSTKTDTAQEYKVALENAVKLRDDAKKTAKLDEVKKKVCETKTKNITDRGVKIASHVDKKVEDFDKIVEKVKKYAEARNKKPIDYQALLERIAAKRAAALEAGKNIKSATTGFSCNGDNPKGQGNLMVGEVKVGVTALKDYKSSISDLITGINASQEQ